MKKGLAIFVLLVILAHFAGFYIYFAAQLTQIRREMHLRLKQLPDEELDLLTLSITDFDKALVNAREVKVNGNMYDIARVTYAGDSVLVYCLRDEAEDSLLSLLDAVLKNSHNDKRSAQQLIHFSLLQYIPVSTTFDFTCSYPNQPHTSFYFFSESTFTLLITSPPPQG